MTDTTSSVEPIGIKLDDFKTWMRIDSDDEDDNLTEILNAAEQYLINAGCLLQDNSFCKLVIKELAGRMYTNRNSAEENTAGMKAQILQLQTDKLEQDYPSSTNTNNDLDDDESWI